MTQISVGHGVLNLRLRNLLVQGQTKTKQSLISQAWCSLNEDTIDFLISN
jgi:hypothetical protein